jgi:hypothetical protein
LPISFHSDGNIAEIVPDLIEIGVTILNPIQPLALDPSKVKGNHGSQLALYGTIDIQRTLPFGTTEDVKNEVINRLKTCGQGGGLILAPTHSVLPDVPVENYLAFIKAAKKYGTYLSDNPENAALLSVLNSFVVMGLLLQKNLVDYEIVRQLPIGMTWRKVKPIVEGVRKEFKMPDMYVEFEYLYNEMKKREQQLAFKTA